MKFSELPEEIQNKLRKEFKEMAQIRVNTGTRVELYNSTGTRYFQAFRHSRPYGGYSYWALRYGMTSFSRYANPLGGTEYEVCLGKPFDKSQNGVEIPKYVDTKKEVMEIVKAIGIFNI